MKPFAFQTTKNSQKNYSTRSVKVFCCLYMCASIICSSLCIVRFGNITKMRNDSRSVIDLQFTFYIL